MIVASHDKLVTCVYNVWCDTAKHVTAQHRPAVRDQADS